MERRTESQLTAMGRPIEGKWSRLSVVLAVSAGACMRLWLLKALPQMSPDTVLYGSMARNLLLHGQFAINELTAPYTGTPQTVYPAFAPIAGMTVSK